MYHALKHFHLLLILISVSLFIIRFGLSVAGSHWMKKKQVKILPHVVDTLLLTSGVALIGYTGFMPFTPESVWMTEKLTCVLAYIALGFVALHYSKGFLFRLIAFLGALGWVYAAAKLALTKTPQLLG